MSSCFLHVCSLMLLCDDAWVMISENSKTRCWIKEAHETPGPCLRRTTAEKSHNILQRSPFRRNLAADTCKGKEKHLFTPLFP